MRVVVPGLLLVLVLGCGGFDQILSQSFEEGFVPTCVDEHAPNVPGLTNPEEACLCAKASVEREATEPMERMARLADPEHMQRLLADCNTDAGSNMNDPAADDARYDELTKAAEEAAAEAAEDDVGEE